MLYIIFAAGVRCNIDEDRCILAWTPEASVWTWRKAASCAAKRHRPLSDPRTAEALIGSRCLALGSVSGEDGRRPLLGLGVKEDALVGAVAWFARLFTTCRYVRGVLVDSWSDITHLLSTGQPCEIGKFFQDKKGKRPRERSKGKQGLATRVCPNPDSTWSNAAEQSRAWLA